MPESASPTSERLDDQGTPFAGPPPRRVVSLVPSLTEAIAATDVRLLVGATDFCTHPPNFDLPRVGGTKWPHLNVVQVLRPDLVVANAEENREEDIAALRALGIPVWVTAPATVDQALESLGRLCAALGRPDPKWLQRASAAWVRPTTVPPVRAVVPIWRKPWMVVGRDTFAGDVLARLGVENVFAGHAERYPRLSPGSLADVDADLVVFPDEPYAFSRYDGPEAWPQLRPVFVSGRHLTWYGPTLAEAPTVLVRQLTGG